MLKNCLSLNRVLTVCLVAVLFSCSSHNKETLKKADTYFGAGTQYLMNQDYTQALTHLKRANELTPGRAEIINNLAMAYYFKGETDLAVTELRRALKLAPENSDAKVNLGTIFYHQGRFEQAEALYKKVLKDLTYDKQARTYYNLGMLEVHKKKSHGTAEHYFSKSIIEDENYCPSHYQLGLLKYERRDFKAALKSFRDSTLGSCYDRPGSHWYQALSMIQLKQFTEARIKLDEIETRFKNTTFAVKARSKIIELNELEFQRPETSHASGTMLTPDL